METLDRGPRPLIWVGSPSGRSEVHLAVGAIQGKAAAFFKRAPGADRFEPAAAPETPILELHGARPGLFVGVGLEGGGHHGPRGLDRDRLLRRRLLLVYRS